jgi:small subunit ribosomal protein S6
MPAKRVSRKAPKVEEERLNDYEMVLILNPEVEDEKLEAIIGNVSRFITERGGTISEVERWGKRKLAYPLKNLLEGNYVLTRFKSKPGLGKELEANLRITDGVLRHLLVKVGS